MRFYTSPVQEYRKIFKAINLRLFLNPILYLAVILVLASCSGALSNGVGGLLINAPESSQPLPL